MSTNPNIIKGRAGQTTQQIGIINCCYYRRLRSCCRSCSICGIINIPCCFTTSSSPTKGSTGNGNTCRINCKIRRLQATRNFYNIYIINIPVIVSSAVELTHGNVGTSRSIGKVNNLLDVGGGHLGGVVGLNSHERAGVRNISQKTNSKFTAITTFRFRTSPELHAEGIGGRCELRQGNHVVSRTRELQILRSTM